MPARGRVRAGAVRGQPVNVAFAQTRSLRTEALISLTAELRQLELIIVDTDPRGDRVSARTFTAHEELPLRASRSIWAAAALDERHGLERAGS